MAEKSNVDIIDSFLPVYKLAKVVGLAPYTIKKKHGITSFEVCWKDIIYSVLVICFCLYVNPMVGMVTHTYKTTREFDIIIYGVKLYFPILVELISGFTILIHRKKFKEFFTSMLLIDGRFNENNIVIDHNKITKSTYNFLFIAVLWIFLVFVSHALETFLIHGLQPNVAYLWNIIKQLHAVVYLSLIMQISIGFINISNRYHLINRKLQEYVELDRIQLASVKIRCKITVNQHENSFVINRGDIVHSIQNLCSIHNDLQRAAKIFNRIYSVVFLIILTNTFVSTTSRLYLLLPGTFTTWAAAKVFANLMYFNGLIFYIIRAAHVITQEVINTIKTHYTYNKTL